jgi:hypothetical protein
MAARQQLASLGLQLAVEMRRFDDGGNAERKKLLDELRAEIEEQVDEQEHDEGLDESSGPVRPLIQADTVETREFTVVGDLDQVPFQIQTPYGNLTVQLSDIRRIDRPQDVATDIRKTIAVRGTDFIQNNPRSTGIRITRGDQIQFRADGQVFMTPWGGQQVSTPDGSPVFGWYVQNEIAGGALMGRIGEDGKPFLIGSRRKIAADRAGMLYLAFAMQDGFADNNQQFPGEYRVRIVVRPAGQ